MDSSPCTMYTFLVYNNELDFRIRHRMVFEYFTKSEYFIRQRKPIKNPKKWEMGTKSNIMMEFY